MKIVLGNCDACGKTYGCSMTYDAVLCRPELQFPKKLWPEIWRKLELVHRKGKSTIHYNPQKPDDWFNRNYKDKYWLYRKLDRQIIYDLRASTVFFVLPKGILYHYHENISHALIIFEPDDVYGIPAGIGHVMPDMYPVDSENWTVYAYYDPDDDEQCEPYCYACYSRHTGNTRSIHDYYYKPEPVFFGTGNRYMGIELEIDGAGEDSGNARLLLELANRSQEKLYIKHDGSLDSGMELVSHPMTLDYHMNHMPWADILWEARELGYRSHQAGTCGLHIHINRTAFGSTVEEQEEVIARLLYFFGKNWEELLKFSRRTHNQLKQWADRYGLKEHPKDILKHAKGDGERYTRVNLLPHHTVEIRMMRGTLHLSSFLASLQLVDGIIDCAMNLSDEEMKCLSWTTFVAGCSHLPELVQYLKERRLFVNDHIESEPEV